MDEAGTEDGPLIQRIKQLERERDDLQKDIEQLCMQQAGPSYLAAATRIHFQRTAGLEQEIGNLRKKVAACIRENQNLQEELSEAYRIKSQLAELHSAEVSKNIEAEKQIKFFQNCVASAFAERDNSIMEAEKAKEQEEILSEKVKDHENRAQALESAYLDERNNNACLQMELVKLKEQKESFEKVISRFYEIREKAVGLLEFRSLEAKCSLLLDDPEEIWIFDHDGKHSPSGYIDSLEQQIVTLKGTIENLQQQMRVGMEIECHLRKRVHHMEKQEINAGNLFRECLTSLRKFYGQERAAIMNILETENSEIKSALMVVQEKTRLLQINNESSSLASLKGDSTEKHDISDHNQDAIVSDTDVCTMTKDEGPTTACAIAVDTEHTRNVLAQALKEKVEALLLLSQQEERHLLETDLNQKKMEDLQRNLVQVTTEKVETLVELAQLKKNYHLLQENTRHGEKHGKSVVDDVDKSIATLVFQERSAKIKNLLKKTYLGRWVGKDGESGVDVHDNLDGRSPSNKNDGYSINLARLKVENATLQESIKSIGHLTSSIQKLRLSILKVMDDSKSASSTEIATMGLDGILHEVDQLKTALSISIPVSWSSTAEETPNEQGSSDQSRHPESSGNERLDPITTVGFEMVELLTLAAILSRENINITNRVSTSFINEAQPSV